MADAGSAIQPEAVAQLRCPRCWFTGSFVPNSALKFRCTRCEWLFTLAAPTIAAPAVPATGVTATSTYATPVAVVIGANGATITNVTVNGATAGTAAGTYIVPAGGSISIAYTVATPTWTWALPAISASVAAGGTSLTFAPTGTNTAFTFGQVLIVDPSGTSDVLVVNGTPTATSVPVSALNSAHSSGVLVTVVAVTPANSASQAVPQNSY